MGWNGLERNKLDFILTDLLPVEISELFSFCELYSFLLKKENQKIISHIVSKLKNAKIEHPILDSSWSAHPLKYSIMKGNSSTREMSLIHPLSALNVLFFIEIYQKEILHFFETHHVFSIRYHIKDTNLFYKEKSKKTIQYFHNQISRVGKKAIQQTGRYFKIIQFESINSFTDSENWRMSNFRYKYYAKIDYKSCFDSIYTHAFKWIIERNTIDSKSAYNSHLMLAIDRILQNINGQSSNGILVGPEFSRMIAEILLQHIDVQVYQTLERAKIIHESDYVVFRYVDDIYVFGNQPDIIDKILLEYKSIGEKYLLRLNELKESKGQSPFLPKEWLEQTRRISDAIGSLFLHRKKSVYDALPETDRYLTNTEFINIDRIKDEISVLVKKYSTDRRSITSFLLSTLLNNIKKKKNGYTLFNPSNGKKPFLLIDLALYIYAYHPSFDQTRKIISVISYINSEINLKDNVEKRAKLKKLIRQYSFIFHTRNIFDLCDWFPFLYEYKLALDVSSENYLLTTATELNDPIILANILLYSRYNKIFFQSTLHLVESTIQSKIDHIYTKDAMMQVEFWFVFVFYNCPYISDEIKQNIHNLISSINQSIAQAKENTKSCSNKAKLLLCSFLDSYFLNDNKEPTGFFNWYGTKNFSEQLTYRTYQRTIFRKFKKKHYFEY